MPKFKISRDQTRLVERNWIPYMIMFAESKLRSNAGKDAQYLNCKIIVSLLKDIELSLKRKLLGSALTLSFNLSDAHCAAFYFYLMIHPIASQQVYEFTFRQQLCDILHRQLFADRPPAHESVPLTINDFIEMIYD